MSLGRLEPAPFSTLQASRICIIKPSSLGDIVQALPVLAALRERFPRARLSWVANRAYAPLLRPISLLDEVIEFDRDKYRPPGIESARAFVAFLSSLAERKFDLAIDLQGLMRSGIMAWGTRAARRIGLASAREGASLFYSDIVDDLPLEQGAVPRYWRLVQAFGAGALEKSYPLELSREERRWASDRLAGLPRPILGINAGARWETKRWPAERFAQAARALGPEFGGSFVVLGGPGEEAVANAVVQRLAGSVINLCGQTSLRQLAAVLESCDALLTNDSGPMHLAAAVGIRVVAIFTCTSPERAGPFGTGHQIVQTSIDCRASYLKCCDRMDCMKELTSDRVAPVLVELLSTNSSRAVSAVESIRREAA